MQYAGEAMRGRPRSPDVLRSKSGKSLGPPAVIHPETLAVRERQLAEDGIILSFEKIELGREVQKRTAEDRLSGFTLGKLLLRYRQDKGNPGGISEAQFEAGETWHRIVRRHASIHGYKLSIKSPSFAMVSFGQGGDEPDDETIKHVREQFKACYDAIMEACERHGIAVRNIIYGVVIEDWPTSRLAEVDYGHLREGLNALVRALR